MAPEDCTSGGSRRVAEAALAAASAFREACSDEKRTSWLLANDPTILSTFP